MRHFLEISEWQLRQCIVNYNLKEKRPLVCMPHHAPNRMGWYDIGGYGEVGRIIRYRKSVQCLWLVDLQAYLPLERKHIEIVKAL